MRELNKLSDSLKEAEAKHDITLTKMLEAETKHNATLTKMLENQEEIKSFYKNTQSDLVKISAQNNSNQKIMNTINDGIVANTVKISSESDIAKNHNLEIEKRFTLITEKIDNIAIPPIQPEQTVKSLEEINTETVNFEENADLNSVQNTT